ncbi:MAG: tRNA (N6-isopentenyl adenosine(37)-C2)-methylthiotransferase MiaB [Candidatus Eisenbacteria bacterium]|uniref:tRNA-2-methylthio-N(6)-dimethylallyladenosine synthase n=1 Tax=Eiseniibacteriota bacterium TaxID=2212470 RepID=A0A538U769_UNCEI|nr:MAG: tRNA (N6-isopentenyl adenosine(37)-C2)-methylthiotransferase MiaB [Candidatus Eisenbacteria bacterium]
MRRVFLETYGCQMNVADSETMAGVLERAGMTLTDRPEDADAVILNTCAIREHAEQRVLGRLGDFARLKRLRPDLIVGVAGCMAQHLRARLLDQARVLDLVVGPDGYRRLPELLRRAAAGPVAEVRLDRDETYGDLEPRRASGVRAWITVQRGCDKFCTYCVVPYTRGRERSLPLADLIGQVRAAVAGGFREVVFLGQTVNSYHDGTHDFADLLRAADAVDGLARIRFTSPHPSDMGERVIAAIAGCDKVCPQVHLPLQSASDTVLRDMARSYTLAQYRDVVARLRAAVPGLALSTDIIVGFPGETEADFARTADYMREVRFDSAFLFKYSARPDTRAWRQAETVPEEEKGRRLERLIAQQHAISGAINDRLIGREVEVLVEGPARRGGGEGAAPGRGDGQLFGKSEHFKTVVFDDDGTKAGALRRVRVVGATPITLIGEAVAAPPPEPVLLRAGA